MIAPRRKLAGNRDILWVLVCTAVCAAMVAVLLRNLGMRHDIYRMGYEVTALTEEHSLLLEENRRLAVEAALQSNTERLEAEALDGLRLRQTDPEQIVVGHADD